MDDWYIEVCKRNANKLSVVEEQPPDCRPRSGSFKYTAQFMTGKCIYVMLACNGSRPQYSFFALDAVRRDGPSRRPVSVRHAGVVCIR